MLIFVRNDMKFEFQQQIAEDVEGKRVFGQVQTKLKSESISKRVRRKSGFVTIDGPASRMIEAQAYKDYEIQGDLLMQSKSTKQRTRVVNLFTISLSAIGADIFVCLKVKRVFETHLRLAAFEVTSMRPTSIPSPKHRDHDNRPF
jgi:hypothetical protein